MKKVFYAVSIILVVYLFSGSVVYGATFNINTGTGSGTGYTWKSPVLTINNIYTNITITGTTTTNRIVVAKNAEAYITLENVDIDVSSKKNTAFEMESGAKVNLTLRETNKLTSGNHNPGLLVPEGATLTITSSSNGSLTARGGNGVNSGSPTGGGAGIGGGNSSKTGTIIINGGNITAYGGKGGTNNISGWFNVAYGGGAGIGGGRNSPGGTITINGGVVNATGGDGPDNTSGGAGIGGGASKGFDAIKITGGTVTATGGIGGGYYGSSIGIGGTGSYGTLELPATYSYLRSFFSNTNPGGTWTDVPPNSRLTRSDTGRWLSIRPFTPKYSMSLESTSIIVYSGNYREMSFGSVAENYTTQNPRTVTVRNTGDQPTGPITVSLEGTDASSFLLDNSYSSRQISSNLIANGNNISFTVVPKLGLTAGPTGTRTYSAIVKVSANEPKINDEVFNVYFMVTRITGISFYSNTVDFGPVPVNYPAQEWYPLTVYNTGNQPTGTLSITRDGPNSSSFTTDPASSIPSISVGGTSSFRVRPNTGYQPGRYSSTITVSNAANGISAGLNVSFTVNPGVWDISLTPPDDKDFGDVPVGYTAQTPHSITVRNAGNQVTGNLSITRTGPDASRFTTNPTSTISSITVNGNPASLTVVPNTGIVPGTYNATVNVFNTANNIYKSFDVRFRVLGRPAISLYPGVNKYFGEVLADYPMQTPHAVTVVNTGEQPTGKLDIKLSGETPTAFKLEPETIADIEPGESIDFTVTPVTDLPAGTYIATVTVSCANVTSKSFDVSLTVNPIAPSSLSFSPSNTTVRKDRDVSLTLRAKSTQLYNGVDCILIYDSNLLEFKNVSQDLPSSWMLLQNTSEKNRVHFGIGNLSGETLTGDTAIATLTFKALDETTGTDIYMIVIPPSYETGSSKLSNSGNPIAFAAHGSTVAISDSITAVTAKFQGHTQGTNANVENLEIIWTRNGEIIESGYEKVTTDRTGEAHISTPSENTELSIWVKSKRMLAVSRYVGNVRDGSTIDVGTLLGGDAFEDNTVDMNDFFVLANEFGRRSPPELKSDFNNDGAVDMSDFFILADNFGRRGAPRPGSGGSSMMPSGGGYEYISMASEQLTINESNNDSNEEGPKKLSVNDNREKDYGGGCNAGTATFIVFALLALPFLWKKKKI